jgi:hypothetical protein
MVRVRWTVVCLLTAVLALAGCGAAGGPGATPAPSWANVVAVPQDADAFATLEHVAPGAARLDSGATVQGTQCWTPSEHLFTDPKVAAASVFRVICRVHYELDHAPRYTDVVCVGDFDKTPMLNDCYIWKPHLGGATFEDGASLASPAPSPFP